MIFFLIILVSKLCYVLAATPVVNKIDNNLNWKTIGGSDAPNEMCPYQVSLRRKQFNYIGYDDPISKENCIASNIIYYAVPIAPAGHHTCGASIISTNYILTAAHCVHNEQPSNYYIVVGSNKLNSGGTIYAIERLFWHKNFNREHGQNDIALVKVYPSITYSDNVRPIILDSSKINEDETVVLSGWGAVNDISLPDQLQYIKLITVSNVYCDKLHSLKVSERHICTANNKGHGACKGDSGGPIIKVYPNGEFKQIGLVSYGSDRSCKRELPDVHTRVSSFIEWVKETCNDCI